jgi:predicted ATPase
MAGLPSGVVTFVFTDIEDSTPMFERLGDGYRAIQDRHRELLRSAWSEYGGREMGTEGDSFFVVFGDPADAVRACIAGQRALAEERWAGGEKVRVRMGLHAGPATPTDGGYTSLSVHAAARVMAAGNGGQVVASELVHDLAKSVEGAAFVDTGYHRLRGFSDPYRLFRIEANGVPADDRPLRTSRVSTSNLPAVEGELVGREKDLEELGILVRNRRCTTITGTGGIGKTRLAIAVAQRALDTFVGCWFVDLQSVTAGADVTPSIAELLQVSPDAEPLAAVLSAIGPDRVLVVLDNCEHVRATSAAFVDAVLHACSNATVLATSREPLGVTSEFLWRVPSLATDHAVELLRDLITAKRGRYEPEASEVEQLVAIADRLDGIPLALELAAARCATMHPSEVAARLDERFRVLAGGNETRRRHRTLETAIAWSVDQLPPATLHVFRRLAVFEGWSLDLAEKAVAIDGIDPYDVDDAVSSLVDKSLVQAELGATPARYSFLETIRSYALADLVASGDEEEARDAHAGAMSDFVYAVGALIPGPQELFAVEQLFSNIGNLQSASYWALRRDDVGRAALLVCRTLEAIQIHGASPEYRAWFHRVLAAVDLRTDLDPAVVVEVATWAGWLDSLDAARDSAVLKRLEAAWKVAQLGVVPTELVGRCAIELAQLKARAGDLNEAIVLCERATATFTESPAWLAKSLATHGMLLFEVAGKAAESRKLLERAVEVARGSGSPRTLASALTELAFVLSRSLETKRLDEVSAELEELAPGLRDADAAAHLTDCASYLIAVRRVDRARALMDRAIGMAARAGEATSVLGVGIGAGDVAAAAGDFAAAEREWRAAADLADRQGRPVQLIATSFRLASLYQVKSDFAAMRRVLEACRPAACGFGGLPEMVWHRLSGDARYGLGEIAEARSAYAESFALVAESSNPWEHATAYDDAATIAFRADAHEDAVRLAARGYAEVPAEQLRAAESAMAATAGRTRDASLRSRFTPARHAELERSAASVTLEDAASIVDRLLSH